MARVDFFSDHSSNIVCVVPEKSMNDKISIFDELVQNHYKKVFQVSLSMLGDKDEALDMTQDVFLKAFRSYKSFRSDASPETWLIRITINRVRDHLRKKGLKRLFFMDSGDLSGGTLDKIEDNKKSPLQSLEEKEFHDRMSRFQKVIKGREREVFALRFGNGLSIKEISEVIGINQSSVKTYLYRSLEKARNHFVDWRKP